MTADCVCVWGGCFCFLFFVNNLRLQDQSSWTGSRNFEFDVLYHTDTSLHLNQLFVELLIGSGITVKVYLHDWFVSLQNKMNVVLVMDIELKRRMRATCLCLGFKMLITVTWCKALQVTLEGELLFCNIWLRTHYVLCHFEYHETLYQPSPSWHFRRGSAVIHLWCCKYWETSWGLL